MLTNDQLGRAAVEGDLAALIYARARGVDVLGSHDQDDLTTLHWAAAGGHPDVVLWLLRVCGADPHSSRKNNFYPLHSAAMQGRTDAVRLLLAAGADPNVQTDPQRYAPMHSAAWGGHGDTIRVLAVAGGDPKLRNYRDETPAETALRQGHRAVAQLLAAGDSAPNKVREMEWGKLVLESGATFKDAKLWPGGAREWDWSETGTRHRPGIQLADVQELLDQGCDVLVLSRGQHLVLETAPEVLAELRRRGVEVLHLESREAVERYNALIAAGRRVGAMIHSTC